MLGNNEYNTGPVKKHIRLYKGILYSPLCPPPSPVKNSLIDVWVSEIFTKLSLMRPPPCKYFTDGGGGIIPGYLEFLFLPGSL